MKAKEDLQALSETDLQVRRAEIMRELMVSQFQLHTGQLQNTSTPRNLRRQLARINTELRKREIGADVVKGTYLDRIPARTGESAAPQAVEATTSAPKRSRFGLGALREALLGRRS